MKLSRLHADISAGKLRSEAAHFHRRANNERTTNPRASAAYQEKADAFNATAAVLEALVAKLTPPAPDRFFQESKR